MDWSLLKAVGFVQLHVLSALSIEAPRAADGSVPIEIGIGEAAGAAVEERRDAHEVVVAPG